MMSLHDLHRGKTPGRGRAAALLASFLIFIAVYIACNQASTPTGQDSPAADGSSLPSGYVVGTTSSLIFATTAPPPPAPEPEPEPETTTSPDDGIERIRSIVLSVDQSCPGCTITTRQGKAFVPESADLLSGGPGDASPISFDQLNAALAPGVPVRIVAEEGPESPDPVAKSVLVERTFAVTGYIGISSDELESRREFTLAFDSESGTTELSYRLTTDAVVESFSAAERVFVKGVVEGGEFQARLVRRDD